MSTWNTLCRPWARTATRSRYNLVRAYAAQPGGLALLLRAALAENPDNPALQGVAADFAGRAFDVLPLPEELTAHGDTISATIGENVRNVLVGKDANQAIIEGDVTITNGDFVGRDKITIILISGKPLPLYVNVPALPSNFLGRDALLGELAGRLCAGQTTALSADGLPGVGKTTLAVALARHPDVLAHFADGVLWAGLGRSPDVASIQATWAEKLGAQITDIADPAKRLVRINDAIGLRRLLIVLDDAWQAEPLDFLRTTGPNVVQISDDARPGHRPQVRRSQPGGERARAGGSAQPYPAAHACARGLGRGPGGRGGVGRPGGRSAPGAGTVGRLSGRAGALASSPS